MLDRKTKDRDATIELLEDRIQQNKNMPKFCIIFGISVLFIASLFWSANMPCTASCLFILGTGLFIISFYVDHSNEIRSLLIYLKQHLGDIK